MYDEWEMKDTQIGCPEKSGRLCRMRKGEETGLERRGRRNRSIKDVYEVLRIVKELFLKGLEGGRGKRGVR